jgi:twitching motility protein PilT
MLQIAPLLDRLFADHASDLILSAHTPPTLRVDGMLTPLDESPFDPEALAAVVNEILTPAQRTTFAEQLSVDFSLQWGEHGRVRGNAFRQRGTVAVSIRAIPHHIPTFTELGLPPIVEDLVNLPHGLVLVTGPTGSGKSTTQASLIDALNHRRAAHIVCIEDPIEYMHANHRSVVEQREVGVDTPSFISALTSALREDPDVILVGEMRDTASIAMAVTIAETGHLVFATLHANDTTQAVNRIVDVFPAEQQQQIRVQLSGSLAAVIHQELLPRPNGGRVAAFEVLVATPPVRNLIRESKSAQLRNVIAMSARDRMQTLEASLNELLRAGAITYDEARRRSLYADELDRPQPVATTWT